MSDDANDAGEALGPALAVLTNHDEAAIAEAAELGFVPPPVEYDPPVPELPSEGPSSDTPPSAGEGEGEGANGSEGGQEPSQEGGPGSGEGEAPTPTE